MNIKNFFLTIAAASGAVPGVAIIASGIGTPPGNKVLFGGVMEALGAISLLLLWVNRGRIKKMNTIKITKVSSMLAILFTICLTIYVVLLNMCVKTEDGATYFPLWTSGDLTEMVRRAGSRDAALDKYGIDRVHEAIRKMPSFALPVTTAVLLLTYQAPFTFLTVAFAMLGIRERAVIFRDQLPKRP